MTIRAGSTPARRVQDGRLGAPADIADAASFLLGPTASFVTGTDLLVDGSTAAGRWIG